MPRYVILDHDWPFPHWDFLLEAGDVLRAWRLLSEPVTDKLLQAEPNADHRPLYLDYEGPVSDGRGHVIRWDFGTYELVDDNLNRVIVSVRGVRLSGIVLLETTRKSPR